MSSDKELGNDPTLPGDFVVVDGIACFDAAFQIVECGSTNESVRFSNNLGNNLAEFIGFLPELTAADLIAYRDYGYTTLSVDERYFGNTNGFEDTFIVTNASIAKVPEPSTVLLLGLGLALFGYSVSRRKTS